MSKGRTRNASSSSMSCINTCSLRETSETVLVFLSGLLFFLQLFLFIVDVIVRVVLAIAIISAVCSLTVIDSVDKWGTSFVEPNNFAATIGPILRRPNRTTMDAFVHSFVRSFVRRNPAERSEAVGSVEMSKKRRESVMKEGREGRREGRRERRSDKGDKGREEVRK